MHTRKEEEEDKNDCLDKFPRWEMVRIQSCEISIRFILKFIHDIFSFEGRRGADRSIL